MTSSSGLNVTRLVRFWSDGDVSHRKRLPTLHFTPRMTDIPSNRVETHHGQPTKIHFHPADRNKQPILDILQEYIDSSSVGKLLEISSGSGQHVAHISPHFPLITFQPTEYEERYWTSIAEYILDEQLTNVEQPLLLDVSSPVESWANGRLKLDSFDYVLNVNLLHVSPWACSEGLFKGCSAVLKSGGLLFTYGPYAVDGVISPQSNVDFDRNLRSTDPSWGLRDVERELKPLALEVGMELLHQHNLPANNMMLVWRKKYTD